MLVRDDCIAMAESWAGAMRKNSRSSGRRLSAFYSTNFLANIMREGQKPNFSTTCFFWVAL